MQFFEQVFCYTSISLFSSHFFVTEKSSEPWPLLPNALQKKPVEVLKFKQTLSYCPTMPKGLKLYLPRRNLTFSQTTDIGTTLLSSLLDQNPSCPRSTPYLWQDRKSSTPSSKRTFVLVTFNLSSPQQLLWCSLLKRRTVLFNQCRTTKPSTQ